MARKQKPHEFKFKIDAYSPETMPLGRLTEYLKDLVELLGEDKNTHLIRIDKGSTVPVLRIDPEAEPKVRQRVQQIERNDAPPSVMEALARINRRLRMDGAKGAIIDPSGDNLLFFPGAERDSLEYGPFNQPGTLDGVPILVGGTQERVPVHLEGRRGERFNCTASRMKAKEIAHFLFTTVVRAEGVGRWIRHPEGEWEMISFKISDFKPLGNVSELSLRDSIEELRQIPAKWKDLEDPVGDLQHLRDDVEM